LEKNPQTKKLKENPPPNKNWKKKNRTRKKKSQNAQGEQEEQKAADAQNQKPTSNLQEVSFNCAQMAAEGKKNFAEFFFSKKCENFSSEIFLEVNIDIK
jgi:hypothetical protein